MKIKSIWNSLNNKFPDIFPDSKSSEDENIVLEKIISHIVIGKYISSLSININEETPNWFKNSIISPINSNFQLIENKIPSEKDIKNIIQLANYESKELSSKTISSLDEIHNKLDVDNYKIMNKIKNKQKKYFNKLGVMILNMNENKSTENIIESINNNSIYLEKSTDKIISLFGNINKSQKKGSITEAIIYEDLCGNFPDDFIENVANKKEVGDIHFHYKKDIIVIDVKNYTNPVSNIEIEKLKKDQISLDCKFSVLASIGKVRGYNRLEIEEYTSDSKLYFIVIVPEMFETYKLIYAIIMIKKIYNMSEGKDRIDITNKMISFIDQFMILISYVKSTSKKNGKLKSNIIKNINKIDENKNKINDIINYLIDQKEKII